MQYIKSKADITKVKDPQIAASILKSITDMEFQYQEPYDATLYGWFVICEQDKDLIKHLPELPFSVMEKINNAEVEYCEQLDNWYEVLVMLNDTEGILIYVPTAIWPTHCLA